jgi:hypothetical protein
METARTEADMTRRAAWAFALGLLLTAGSRTASPADSERLASLWYRGRPAGVPRAEDLGDIRAAGFTAVTWPAATAGVDELQKLAKAAGLDVVLRPSNAPATFASALTPHEFVDVRVGQDPGGTIAPLAWRAIAHGARVISFDPGRREGTGLSDERHHHPPWVSAAGEVARQLRANGALFAQCRRGPAVVVDRPAPVGLDVTLLEARKSWVLVATNGSGDRVRATAHLPVGIPYALWLNLLDASTMAMLEQPRGPQWTANLEPHGVRIYVIDKALK